MRCLRLIGAWLSSLALASLGGLALSAGAGEAEGTAKSVRPETGPGVRLLGHVETEKSGAPHYHVDAVTLLPSGKQFAAVNHAGSVHVWDRSGRRAVRKFSHFDLPEARQYARHGIAEACISRDGQFACMVDCFNNVSLWDLSSGKLAARHTCEVPVVCDMAASAGAKQVALAGFTYTKDYESRGMIVLWKPHEDTTRILRPKDTERISAVDFQPNGPLLAVGECLIVEDLNKDQRWRHSLWNAKTAKLDSHLPYVPFGEEPLQFDPKGRYLAAMCEQDTGEGWIMAMQMWDVEAKRALVVGSYFPPLAFSPRSPAMAVCYDFEQVVLLNYRTHSTRAMVKFDWKIEQPKTACFSADGRLLIVGTTIGRVYLFDVGGDTG